MPRSRSLLCSVMLLLVLVMLFGVPAFSQDPPGVAMGMNPQATYHSGDFDSVDLATGRLNLHIPLVVDHSQRGKLNFTYSLTYSSPGTWSGVMSGSPYNPFYNIEPSKYGFSVPALVTDGLFPSSWVQKYHDDSGYYYEWFVSEGGYGIGATHPMGSLDGVKGDGTKESIDGSGIRHFWSNSYSTDADTNKEGIQVTIGSAPNTVYVEDANGNRMTTTATWNSTGTSETSTTTDTLGRTWTSTTGITDVTGCPTGGPVAPTASTIWTIPGPANSMRTFKFCYSGIYFQTSFNSPPYQEYSGGAGLITGVVLPDGTTWRLDYDNNSYGDLIAVYPPTGGHISYTWKTGGTGADSPCDGGVGWGRIVSSRTISDGLNSYTWQYNWQYDSSTVTDPLGNDTVSTINLDVNKNFTDSIGTIKYYSGSAATGTLLKTVNKTYRDLFNPFPSDVNDYCSPDPQLLTSTTTTWPNGQQNQVQNTYDSGLTFKDNNPSGYGSYTSSYGLITSETHSDYGGGAPGPVISATNTGYLALSNSSYVTANILDLPSSVVITDGTPPRMRKYVPKPITDMMSTQWTRQE